MLLVEILETTNNILSEKACHMKGVRSGYELSVKVWPCSVLPPPVTTELTTQSALQPIGDGCAGMSALSGVQAMYLDEIEGWYLESDVRRLVREVLPVQGRDSSNLNLQRTFACQLRSPARLLLEAEDIPP